MHLIMVYGCVINSTTSETFGYWDSTNTAGQNPPMSAMHPIATIQGITGSLANACFYACRPGIICGGVIMNRGSKFVPFCVLATILTASFPARANTIIFQCGTNFAVDLKNSTVNNQPATINATAIDWYLTPGPANDTRVIFYHILFTIERQHVRKVPEFGT